MSQNDLVIANQTFPATRADINSALQALGSLNSGPSEPSTLYANMLWYDTTYNILKMRSEADDAWIDVGTLDQSLNTFTPSGVAELTQGQAEDSASTVFGQVSGQRLAQAVAAAATASGLTRVSLFTSSGTFNVPADASTAMVLYTGGGGGGAKRTENDSNNNAGGGGTAGFGFKIFDLTPSAAETITIGAGGAGVSANVGNGTSGGDTIAFGFTATGGTAGTTTAAGADGSASSTFPPSRTSLGSTYAIVDAPAANKNLILRLQSQGSNSSATAVVYSEAGGFQGGLGGPAGKKLLNNDGVIISDTDGKGGVGGFVGIWY